MTAMKENQYFEELSTRLRQEGFAVRPQEGELLPIQWNGHPLCWITKSGGIRYKPQDMINRDTQLACDRVTDIAAVTAEYMKLMERAPVLVASGLDEEYRLLADFNGTVLAGHRSRYGVQFVTWDWSYNKTGLSQGHYMSDYEAAKQDFAVRAGLVDKNYLFSDEQLVEMYRCIHETLESEYPITAEREKLLKDTAYQIECGVSNLEELTKQSNQRELKLGSEGTGQLPDMIQSF